MNDLTGVNYEDFVKKIEAFEQTSILMSTLRQCWDLFDKDKKNYRLTPAAIFSRIFAIAMATESNSDKKITPDELEALSEDYYFIESGCSYDPNSLSTNDPLKRKISDLAFFESEVNNLLLAIDEKKEVKKYNIQKSIVKESLMVNFVQRELGLQFEDYETARRNMARSWAVLKFLGRNLLKENVDINKFLCGSRGFNMQPIAAFTSAIAIISAAKNSQIQGLFCVENIVIEKSIAIRANIDHGTLKLLASRLAASVESYKAWHTQKVLTLGGYYKKYAPSFIYELPLVDAKELISNCPKNAYFCPAPSIFINYVSEMFFKYLRDNEKHLGVNIKSKMGDAYEEYIDLALGNIFPEGHVKEKISDLANEEKKADFVIETDNAIWIIECKKSIGGVRTRTISSPKDIVDSWAILLGACEQCSATAKQLVEQKRANGKPIIPVILIADTIILEGKIFQKMAFNSKIFECLNLEYVEIFPLDMFEEVFISIEEKNIVAAIQKKWAEIKRGDDAWFCKDVCDIAPLRDKASIPSEFPHLTPYYDEILPRPKS